MPSKTQLQKTRDRIFAALNGQAKCRSTLVHETGLARTTIYDHLMRALADGEVRRFAVKGKSRGRPKVFWEKLDTVVISNVDGVIQPDLSRVES